MKWDLTYFYENDQKWEEDLKSLEAYLPKITAFASTLNNEDKFVEYILLNEEIERKLYKVYQYASLLSDLNKKNVENSAKVAKVMSMLQNLSVAGSFANPEILSIGEEKVMDFITAHPEIESYRFTMEKLFHQNEHVLDGKSELLLSHFNPLCDAGSSLYSTLAVADNVNNEVILSDGSKIVVSQGSWRSQIQEAKTADDRRLIFEAIFSKYEENKNTYARIYEAVLQADMAQTKARNYKSILESHLFANNISLDVFTNLIDVASTHTEAIKRYNELRKKYLHLDEYHTYDRFLELASSSKKYSYEQAKELFFESIKSCPIDFQNKAHEVLKEGFVDVYEQDGKRSGAYSSSIPGSHPFILLNYCGTLDDVFTVAHESGHSIHSMYSAETQKPNLQDYTIFVAEIASTFNEHMLLDYLMKNDTLSKDEKIMLLQKAIDEIISTFYRQTLFAHYEYEASKLIESYQPINHEVLSNIMIDLYDKYYGIDIKKEKVKQYVWAYIPHLFYTPFYVYQYATSFAASFALYKNVKDGKPDAFNKYVNLLKSGGSKYPLDQALEAGIDFTKKEAFMAVCERMEELVDQLEKLIGE